MVTALERKKARGIPFRDDLVPKIMRGEKTQTRRIITPQPATAKIISGSVTHYLAQFGGKERKPRYGPIGSIVYVKEALYMDEERSWRYKADDASVDTDSDDAQRWLDDWYNGKRTPYRTTRYMPKWAARTFLKLLDYRIDTVQAITDEGLFAEGMSVHSFVELLRKKAKGISPPNPWWIAGGDDEATDYCRPCAEKALVAAKDGLTSEEAENLTLAGGYVGEEDSRAHCESCGKLLDYTLTNYGVDSELDHFEREGIRNDPEEAYLILRILGDEGYPLLTEGSNRPELAGDIARLQFRYIWDLLHKEAGLGWDANPWVDAYTFTRLA